MTYLFEATRCEGSSTSVGSTGTTATLIVLVELHDIAKTNDKIIDQ